jgi:hypothetical protein
MDLSRLPSPARTAEICTLQMLPELCVPPPTLLQRLFTRSFPFVTFARLRAFEPRLVDLFDARRLRGFWPCHSHDEKDVVHIAVRVLTVVIPLFGN